MRLIDANRLVENIKAYSKIEGTKLSKTDGKIIDCIISHIETLEPTVETIPKVKLQEIVDRLEEFKTDFIGERFYEKHCGKILGEQACVGRNCFYCSLSKTIEIVKEVGRMNENCRNE